MIENGVKRIYTYNRADFEILADLEVLTPEELLTCPRSVDHLEI